MRIERIDRKIKKINQLRKSIANNDPKNWHVISIGAGHKRIKVNIRKCCNHKRNTWIF